MITDMLNNKKIYPMVTELFISDKKLNICFVFIMQSSFAVLKIVRLNCTHYVIMKIPNIGEFKQIASHNSSDFDFQGFINLYKKCTAKPRSFLVNVATLVPLLMIYISQENLQK